MNELKTNMAAIVNKAHYIIFCGFKDHDHVILNPVTFFTVKRYFITSFQAHRFRNPDLFLDVPSIADHSCTKAHHRLYVLMFTMLSWHSWIEHSSLPTAFQNFTHLVFEARIAKIQDGWLFNSCFHVKCLYLTLSNIILETRIWLADIVHPLLVQGIHTRGNLIGVT